MPSLPTTLLIACGALAREITGLIEANGWDGPSVQCLPAHFHNTPGKIPSAVREQIHRGRERFDRVLVLYGDCGTGGLLDAVLAEEGVERIEGTHCYEFYAGAKAFSALAEEEPGTFFLTDYLARHFDRLIVGGLGLDRHPRLLKQYFGNYRRLVHLAQIEDAAVRAKAEAAAERLGLAFEYRFTGLGGLERFLGETAGEEGGEGEAGLRLKA